MTCFLNDLGNIDFKKLRKDYVLSLSSAAATTLYLGFPIEETGSVAGVALKEQELASRRSSSPELVFTTVQSFRLSFLRLQMLTIMALVRWFIADALCICVCMMMMMIMMMVVAVQMLSTLIRLYRAALLLRMDMLVPFREFDCPVLRRAAWRISIAIMTVTGMMPCGDPISFTVRTMAMAITILMLADAIFMMQHNGQYRPNSKGLNSELLHCRPLQSLQHFIAPAQGTS